MAKMPGSKREAREKRKEAHTLPKNELDHGKRKTETFQEQTLEKLRIEGRKEFSVKGRNAGKVLLVLSGRGGERILK